MWRNRFLYCAKAAGTVASTSKSDEQVKEAYASTGSSIKGGETRVKSALQISISKTKPGALLNCLTPLESRGFSIRNISNRRAAYNESGDSTTMFLDIEGHADDPLFQEALTEMKKQSVYLTVTGSWKIPWFPTSIAELDKLDQTTLVGGSDNLMDDPENPHPGFHDQEYRARRSIITKNALIYKHGMTIPNVEYTESENACWTNIWDKLTSMYPTMACKQYNYIFPRLVEGAGYSRDKIPQLEDLSQFLNQTTGFSLRPVTGLLSSRDFLNALAFRTFFSTQYIRHPSKPFYTPEPDVVHELMGHAPLFADPAFADFTQKIGLASLGASDEDVVKLARCYWYSVEFGLCLQGGKPKAYGAGVLSSIGEMEHAITSGIPTLKDWDPYDAAKNDFPITTVQPLYYVAQDFQSALTKLSHFADSLEPPFTLEYNSSAKKVMVFPRDAESYMSGGK